MPALSPWRLCSVPADRPARTHPMNPALPFAVADHPVPEAFGTSGEHAKLELRSHGIVNLRPGEIVPNRTHVDAVLAFGRTLRTERASLLVHCHAGISPSTASMAPLIARRCRTCRRPMCCGPCTACARRPDPTCDRSR